MRASGTDAAQAAAQRALLALFAFTRRVAARAWDEQSRRVWVPWAMIALQSAAVIAICLYVGTATMLYMRQRSMNDKHPVGIAYDPEDFVVQVRRGLNIEELASINA